MMLIASFAFRLRSYISQIVMVKSMHSDGLLAVEVWQTGLVGYAYRVETQLFYMTLDTRYRDTTQEKT